MMLGVLFGLVWLKIHGTGLDGFCSIYQGHLFFQKATYDWECGIPGDTSISILSRDPNLSENHR